MEGALFLIILGLIAIYITLLSSRNALKKLIKKNDSETSRKLKILVDNQLELHDLIMELKSKAVDNEDATIEDIDKIITDLEFDKLKNQILDKDEENLEKVKEALREEEDFVLPEEELQKDLINENEKQEVKKDFSEEKKQIIDKEPQKKEKHQKEIETVEVDSVFDNTHQDSKKEQPKEKKKLSFKERFPDLEKFIGENLINKIGIVITVIGIIFSVKYAIDNDYINEYGRVLIGIAAGGILIGVAHKLRIKYKAFSSVLVGGGLATLYFTIGLAFQEYQIFSQTVAFAIMLVITIFSVLLSILYDKQELAVLAIIGGFATPLAVSTGNGNYKILFSYLAMLNIGMLALAYFKKWRIVNIVSYFFTVVMYGAWLGKAVYDDNLPLKGAFFYATLFYFIFFFQNIIYNIKEYKKFKAWEFFILLSNSFAYFAAGLYILHYAAPELKGLFTGLVAVFNFIFAYSLFRKSEIDRNLVFLLIGLVLSFISLIGPIQLEGNYITLFWAAEAVILLWMWQKTEIKLIKLASVLVLLTMFISLFIDWENIYFRFYPENQYLNLVFNKGFLTGITVLVSLTLSIILLKNEKQEYFFKKLKLTNRHYLTSLVVALVTVLYLVPFFEFYYHLKYFYESIFEMNAVISTYNLFFLLALIVWFEFTKYSLRRKLAMAAGFLGLGTYLFYILPAFAALRNLHLQETLSEQLPLVSHYIGLVIVLIILGFNLKNIKLAFGEESKYNKFNLWFSVFFFLGIMSAEIDNVILFAYYDISGLVPFEGAEEVADWQISDHKQHILSQSHKIAFPVLWGISSFVLMVIGLRNDLRQLRIISLVVFFITVLKLFAIDVWEMEDAGRILSFVVLGILLLVVSFMYQKLKLLVMDKEDEEDEKIEEKVE